MGEPGRIGTSGRGGPTCYHRPENTGNDRVLLSRNSVVGLFCRTDNPVRVCRTDNPVRQNSAADRIVRSTFSSGQDCPLDKFFKLTHSPKITEPPRGPIIAGIRAERESL